MEKKIKRAPESAKAISDKDEEETIILTILVALVIFGALLVYLVFFTPAQEEHFASIYYLDSEKQLENIPKTVVLGENSTILLWVGVENQYDETRVFTVRVKMDDGTGSVDPSPVEPIQSFEKALMNTEVWEFPVNINIDQSGNHRLIFELWFSNETNKDMNYTGNWVCLSIEAIQT
jgi:uncharacterized membrane protein